MSASISLATGVFDRVAHKYTYGGTRLLSVTESIRAAGLINCDWYTEASRVRGKMAHMAVQYDADSDLDETTVRPEIWPYVLAARKFKAETGYVSDSNEQQVFLPQFGYAGTLDTRGHVGTHRIVLDWKSGVMPFWAAYQLAAYANAFADGPRSLRWGVQLKSNGDYKVTAFEPQTYRRDLADFFSFVRVAQIKQERGIL